MDVNGFREAQSPFFFTQPPQTLVETRVKSVAVATKTTAPTGDNRYPGYAAMMSDGRIATDYRPTCSQNLAAGTQYPSRLWMQHNAEEIIALSRDRLAKESGAGSSYDASIELDPIGYAVCDSAQCGYIPSTNPYGLGIERKDKAAPLFGTWAASSPSYGKKDPQKLTTFYEGGRNTVRGVF
uniref:Uncharacterized protein n=1 Tax=viral metagenome TaxID=1070528 RepID=A0A6C0KLR1_9ZZZZ